MNTTQKEKSVKELLLGKTWEYLNDNFHKFKQAQKIKIALTLCSKDIPQEIEHSGGVTIEMPTIQRVSGEAFQEMEFRIGTPRITEALRHSGQAPSDN